MILRPAVVCCEELMLNVCLPVTDEVVMVPSSLLPLSLSILCLEVDIAGVKMCPEPAYVGVNTPPVPSAHAIVGGL